MVKSKSTTLGSLISMQWISDRPEQIHQSLKDLAIGLNLAISNHCMMMSMIRIIIGDEECYEPFPPFNLSLPPPLQVLSKGTSLATQINFKPNRPNEKRQIWHIFNGICISDELGILVTLFFLNLDPYIHVFICPE